MTSHLHAYTFKKTIRVIAAVVTAIGGVALITGVVFRLFTIREVLVDAPGMAIELDRTQFGQNLLFLPAEKLRHDLLTAYPLLQSVQFEKRYPSTLVVHLAKKSPFAVLRSGGTYYAVDEEGAVVGVISDSGPYSLITIELGMWSIGSVIRDARLNTALTFLKKTKTFFPIRRISERDGSYLSAEGEHTNIFIPQNGDVIGKASTLQVIVEGFRIKGTLPTVIDLRFDKPIITN